jgi:hypothetical protein
MRESTGKQSTGSYCYKNLLHICRTRKGAAVYEADTENKRLATGIRLLVSHPAPKARLLRPRPHMLYIFRRLLQPVLGWCGHHYSWHVANTCMDARLA